MAKGMGVAERVLVSIISVVLIFEVARYGFPLIATALANLTTALSGWALIGFFTATGVIGLLLMSGLFFGVWKVMKGGFGGR